MSSSLQSRGLVTTGVAVPTVFTTLRRRGFLATQPVRRPLFLIAGEKRGTDSFGLRSS